MLPSISIQFESINKHVAECKCWEDLSWQGVRAPGIKSACESEPCDANGRVEADIVASAKAWIRNSPDRVFVNREKCHSKGTRTCVLLLP
jgi:hypothetical protein